MRKRLLALWALLAASPAGAFVSSSTLYTLDRSVFEATGSTMSGGVYSLIGASGQNMIATPYDNDVLSSPDQSLQLRAGFLNPPALGQSSSTALVLTAPGATVTLPANSVPLASYDAVIKANPVADPVRVEPAKILAANQKLVGSEGAVAQPLANGMVEMNIITDTGFYDGNFASPASLTITYADANGDGIVDGTNPPVRVKTLSVWTLDEQAGVWTRVPGATVDTTAKVARASIPHFSVYALIGTLDTELDPFHVYPVPFRPNGPNAGTAAGQTGTDAAGITFNNVPSEGTIEIYTLAGALVRRIELPLNLAPARVAWDTRNSAGDKVASGVYLWRVKTRNNTKTGRLMIIR